MQGRGCMRGSELLCGTDMAHLLQVGQKLDAVVELDKEDYLVLSFPERPGVVGFAATSDFNLQAQRSFSLGQKLQATVMALPTESTGRLCLTWMHWVSVIPRFL